MCNETSQVHAYHDNAMSNAEREAFELHLATCAECREMLDDLRGLSRMFAEVPLPPMPAGAVHRMHASWHQARAIRERGVRRLAEVMTAAAAVVLAVVLVRTPTSESQPDSAPALAGWVETVAVMPPMEQREGGNPEMVQFARWMASDLGSPTSSN